MATTKKLSPDEFILKAIRTLRDVENGKAIAKGKATSKGIHSVYSGFNSAFKAYFGADADPVSATKSAAERGIIEVGFRKGGAQLYLPGEGAVENNANRGAGVLKAMGL